MEIRINSGEELNKLLDALATDIVDANIFHQLFTGLMAATSEFPREISQSNMFWWLTMQAIKEAYLTRLCRIFDQHSQSLNLVNLLDTLKANLHFFQESHFRERLKGNAFINSLAEGVRVPSIEELQTDVQFASLNNQIVSKLMLWRNNIHAHTGAKATLGKAAAVEANRIEEEEIEILLDQCFSMLNKYMNMYKATSWSRRGIGHDDYLSLFKFMRLGLEKYESDIQNEIDSFSSGS
jgi:hypothetical protein